jgi:hypothetical protein
MSPNLEVFESCILCYQHLTLGSLSIDSLALFAGSFLTPVSLASHPRVGEVEEYY